MKKILAKSLLVVIEAGIEVLSERIKKRRKRNGNSCRLDHFPYGNGAYDLRDGSTAHSSVLGGRRAMRKRNTRRRSISKG